MRYLVILSVVLGMAYASPILPRNPVVVAAENQAFLQHKAQADAAFIQEYNRLALLAAQAPDIHIITDDRQHPEAQPIQFQTPVAIQNPVMQAELVPTQSIVVEENNTPLWNGPLADTVSAGVNGLPQQVTETPEVKAARQSLLNAHAAVAQPDPQYNSSPAENVQPAQALQESLMVNPVSQEFSFQTMHQPESVANNQASLLAGHLAGHLADQHTQVSPLQTLNVQIINKKWDGPFADTVPAGVNGAPQQVTETPAVQAARQALYAAHAAVPQPDPIFN